ncbi:ABC transporter permease [Candidatus Magnetomorum sp. HK-1]|nr:ABC transporter permease [Candidatus Magnetomorum sp. HK-1]
MNRFWSIFIARNKEYYRDRASFGWNIVFPFLIILGFGIIFQRGGQRPYKVALLTPESPSKIESNIKNQICSHDLFECIPFKDKNKAIEKLNNHKLDIIIQNGNLPLNYWINTYSPNSIISEGLLVKLLTPQKERSKLITKQSIQSEPVYYIEWLFPGIISMGVMFSSLFGIGFTIVRYRQNGVLKRLKATPLTAFEYLCAQILSRLFLILLTNTILFTGCSWLFDFHCKGSLFHLLIFFSIGTIAVISLGLIIAARIQTEELANGLLNLITWPMMFLSEVWFSIEGAPKWVQDCANLLPLSHMTRGLRMIINDGAHLFELKIEILILCTMSIIFMAIGSGLFKWTRD